LLEVDTDADGTTDVRVNLTGITVNGLNSADIQW
jgi:hypothetical protein